MWLDVNAPAPLPEGVRNGPGEESKESERDFGLVHSSV